MKTQGQAQTHPIAKTIVVGLGVTGLSCVRRLAAQGVPLAVADSGDAPPGLAELQRAFPDIPVFLGPFDAALLASADRLVVSPGVPVATTEIAAAAAQGVELLGDIELFVREANAPIVAITGSNGKSTVTTLVGEMAKAAGIAAGVGGNLGRPALDLLAEPVELYVLELSSFQLETTRSLRAAIATVLNVSPDHMDRYPDVETYAAAKARIFANAGVGVFNADDPLVTAMGGVDDRWTFTLGPAVGDKAFGLMAVDGQVMLCRGAEPLLAADALRMPGRHNQANALAALAIGTVLGLDRDVMLEVLQRFPGLPHRTEFVAERDGVRWYNDSKGTNVGAAVAALRGLHRGDHGRTVLIAGGDCKGADFAALGAVLGECARAVVLLGRDAARIAAVVPPGMACETAATLEDAVARAASFARPGDRVLLTKGIAVEGTAIIATEFRQLLIDKGMRAEEIDACQAFASMISVLPEARVAWRIGGVSALHDVTEGGIATALAELSQAGGADVQGHW